ncbi:MAG: pentachlorophenol monooxygenase [Micromonosporaceae bacterium]|nr:pentachlorophenol monooxygenase [Micromonosporaceae bacterium]
MLVIGAGPVGLGTALLLARRGVPTIVCEVATEHQIVGSRSICTQRDVIDIFARIGCAEELLDEGVTWRTGRTFYREHELVTVNFPDPGGAALPPWINISQASVEGRLLERVAAEPLVDLRWGCELTALSQDDAGVTVRTSQDEFRGDYLVAADGARSTARRLLGVDFPGESYVDKFLIADIRAELPFPNERRFHFDPEWNPGRQVLVHQCPDSVWRIDWQVPPDYDLEAERASGALDARIRRITGDRPYEMVWLTVYRFHERCAEEFRVGRVFLAGDAAHLYAPFGARGLNSGMQDAENLAWKLAYALRGWGTGTLLDSYHVERRAAARENLRVTSETMRFLAPQSDAEWAARRDVLERAVTDPGARRHINSGKLAEPYWYLDSPLTTPDGGADDFPAAPGAPRPPVAGVLCPDPPCLLPGGRRGRLRELFGGGFVVLADDPEGVRSAAAAAVGAPVAAYPLKELDLDGAVRSALGATDRSVHLVRPDGHLAAALPDADPGAVAAAVRRACGGQ